MREKAFTLIYMVAVSVVFTGAVAGISRVTRERVRLNQELAEKRVVMKVLGIEMPATAGLQELSELYEKRVKETGRVVKVDGKSFPILGGHTEEGELIGYAFKISGRGFWDRIEGYLAVAPDRRRILGISFHKQSETPGLGAEITKEWFENQFKGKEIPSGAEADATLIRLLPPGSELGPHDVDAVTGATGTSRAVERFLNEYLRRFLETMSDKAQR